MPRKKPEQQQIDKVARLAQALYEQGKDKYGIAQVLLYLLERNKKLEDLRDKAEYYVRFGMGESELTALRRALDKMREEDVVDADDSSFFARE